MASSPLKIENEKLNTHTNSGKSDINPNNDILNHNIYTKNKKVVLPPLKSPAQILESNGTGVDGGQTMSK